MSVDAVECFDCDRQQAVADNNRLEVRLLEHQAAADDPEVRKFLEAIGWRFRDAKYVPLDYSGMASAARWLCPFCVVEDDS